MDSELKSLSIDQRIRLVEDLWDSVASDQRALALTTAQRQELDRRLDAFETDWNRGRDADVVIAEVRLKL